MNQEIQKKKIAFNGQEFPCCASLTMSVIGGKWKTVILYHLIDGTLRYSEIRKAMPTVTERTLSLQLKKLETDRMVKRTVFYEKPPLKVEYSLTTLGKTLVPVIKAIADWGDSVIE